MSVTTLSAAESTNISIPIDFCADSLFASDGTPYNFVTTVRKILQNIVDNPSNEKFHSLNSLKVLPLLTNPNLAGWYMLRHAGFFKVGDKLLLTEGLDLAKIQTVLEALEKASTRANAKVQAVLDKESAELAAADARLAERIAKRQEEEKEAAEKQRLNELETAKDAHSSPTSVESQKSPSKSSTTPVNDGMNDGHDDAPVQTPQSQPQNGENAQNDESSRLTDEELARELQEQLDAEAAMDAEDQALDAKSGTADVDTNFDTVDPELLRIAKEAKERLRREAQGTKKPKLKEGLQPEKPLSEMTYDEKMEWLAKKKADNKVRSETQKIEAEKAKYLNQKNTVHAMQDLQEKLEMDRMRQAASIRAKEDREKKAAMARLRERAALDKARRQKEAAERAAELARIQAQKAANQK